MRFLADLGVSIRVVDSLRESAHDVVHLRDEGLQRMQNGEIFRKAAREDRIVLTFDLDFGEIAAGLQSNKPSVIVFRLRNTRTEYVLQRLSTVLSISSEKLLKGEIVERCYCYS